MHAPHSWFLALALLPAVSLSGQANDTVTIARATAAVDLDGRVDEAEWSSATHFPLTMFTPTAGAAPRDTSQVRLMHDDRYLYASGVFLVADPTSLRPGLYTRDALGAEDHFMIILNPSGDGETGHIYTLVPSGARTDYSISGDGVSIDKSWNGHWDGTAIQLPDGWSAEMRIPLSSLRFQEVNGTTVMGLIVHRFTSVTNGYDTYPSLSPRFANALFRMSIAGRVALHGVRGRSPLYLMPFAIAGVNSQAILANGNSDYLRQNVTNREAGLDVKVGLSSSTVLDLTVNTDFAQAEADLQQVNLTRFSLFFPEKRQFFLERADLFSVRSGGADLLFHSRRIGLAADGTPLRLYAGGRMLTRTGEWDVGLLSMQVEDAAGSGSENTAVARIRRNVLNPGSYIGALATSRIGGAAGDRVTVDLDGVIRVFGNDFAAFQVARTLGGSSASTDASSGMLRLGWSRRANQGLQYDIQYRSVGQDFAPALGFQQRTGVDELAFGIGYGVYPEPGGLLRSITPRIDRQAVSRHADGVLDNSEWSASLSASLRSGASMTGTWIEVTDRPLTAFPIAGGVTIPAGEYPQGIGTVGYFSSNRSKLAWNASVTAGDYFHGSQRGATLGGRWNVSPHLQLSLDATRTKLEFPGGTPQVVADFLRVRSQYALDTHLSVDVFLQYSGLSSTLGANARLRYQFAEGRDLWMVYNDALLTDRTAAGPGLPRRPLSSSRTLLIKYVHLLTP